MADRCQCVPHSMRAAVSLYSVQLPSAILSESISFLFAPCHTVAISRLADCFPSTATMGRRYQQEQHMPLMALSLASEDAAAAAVIGSPFCDWHLMVVSGCLQLGNVI